MRFWLCDNKIRYTQNVTQKNFFSQNFLIWIVFFEKKNCFFRDKERQAAEDDIQLNTTLLFRAPEMLDLYRAQVEEQEENISNGGEEKKRRGEKQEWRRRE